MNRVQAWVAGAALPVLIGVPATAAAQVDSAFAISRAGVPLLRVNADGRVGIATAAPDRRLVVDSGGVAFRGVDGFVATGILNQGTIPAVGEGERMMWYPGKSAFRAGHANLSNWSDANIGAYSVAMGNSTKASGHTSTALGYDTDATGYASTSLGFGTSATGDYSLAAGYVTTASGKLSTTFGTFASTDGMEGAVVFGDASTLAFATLVKAPAPNTFSVRAAGGIWLGTTSTPSIPAGRFVNTSTGAYLSLGGTWTNASDRNLKHAFLSVASEDVLHRLRTLPIASWSYRADDGATRHLGPTAQDFHRSFGLGADSLSIATVDADGVALAAAQALEHRTSVLRAENHALRRELAALRDAHAALLARVERLESAAAPR